MTETRGAEGESADPGVIARFTALFRHSPSGFALLRVLPGEGEKAADAVYVAVNPTLARMNGLPAQDIVGQRASKLLPPPIWERLAARILPVGLQGGTEQFELFSPLQGQPVEVTAFAPMPGHVALVFTELPAATAAEAEQQAALAQLRERVKEATLLHRAGRLLAKGTQTVPALLAELVNIIPLAWQEPALTAARIRFDGEQASTPHFRETEWQQTASFTTPGDRRGTITVAYLGTVVANGRRALDPFLPEEAATLETLARMVQTELARREAEQHLRFQAQLLDGLQETVVAADLEEKINYWGPGAALLSGLSREQVLGKPLTSVIPLAPPEAARVRRALDTRGSWRGEFSLPDRTGARRWISLTVSTVRDEQGEPLGLVAVGRDSTQRRQREEELATLVQVAEALRGVQRPSDLYSAVLEQMRTLFQASGVAIGLEEEGGTVRIEAATAEWRHVEGLVLPAEGGITGQVIASQEPFASDNMVREKALSYPSLFREGLGAVCLPLLVGEVTAGVLWVVRAAPFVDADLRLLKAVTGMVAGTLQRVTLFERVEAQALQMQRLVDTVEEGLLLLDGDGEIVLANPAADRYLGVLAVEADESGRWQTLGGRPLQRLLQPPPAGATAHELVVHGPLRIFELLAHPVTPGPAGNSSAGGWVLVLRDVTEERRMQEQIQQQERLAAVGQMAAGIAHDFNNIMSAIVLYSQLLQQSDYLRAKDRQRMALIYDQAQEATSLVRQILDFSRRSVLKRQQLDLVTVVDEALALLRRTLPENVQIVWSPPAGRYLVEGDENRLKQVVMNLALNARDAMPDGGRLALAVDRLVVTGPGEGPLPELAPGAWLRLRVSDTGTGIDSTVLPHIFEPFFTTKGPAEGAGLGLSQVHGIVHQHHGRITVESERNRGTTVAVYLPLLAEVAAPAREAQAAPAPAAQEQAATILLVEDEVAVREALAAILDMLGYRVLAADDGQSALALFRETEEQIDLVLSDLVMARMGGEQLYHRLQQMQPDLKMIVLTGYPLEDKGKALLEQGIVAWIQKPVSLDELQAQIAAALAA